MRDPAPLIDTDRLRKDWRKFICWTFHRERRKLLQPDPIGPQCWPFDWEAVWWCPDCDNRGLRERPRRRAPMLALGAAALLLLAGCSAPGPGSLSWAASAVGVKTKPKTAAQPTRPACADKVARAWVSPMVIPGAYACMVMDQGANLAHWDPPIQSDNDWAAANAARPGLQGPVYNGQLADGAFVYVYRVAMPDGTSAYFDLLLWIGPSGEVMNYDFTGRFV